MRAQCIGRRLIVAVGLVLLAGCGIDIDLSGPKSVTPGETATFQVKATNVSACPLFDPGLPMGIDFAFAAFVPGSTIEENELFAEICGLTGPSRFAGSSSLAEVGAAEVGVARDLFEAVAAQAADASCSGPGATCSASANEVVCDTGGAMGVGEMRTLSCDATVPPGLGPFYSIAVSTQFAVGVCKAASASAGAACIDASQCGGAGLCGSGICVEGTNAGNGCDLAGDCTGGTCTSCSGDFALGVACFASARAIAPAPALAPWAIAVALAGLGGVAFLRLRARRG
jgi:hypothetical protein